MKTHKIKYGGEYTWLGWDETFRTYCGITEECSEDMAGQFVLSYEDCSCKVCQKSYEKEMRYFDKQLKKLYR